MIFVERGAGSARVLADDTAEAMAQLHQYDARPVSAHYKDDYTRSERIRMSSGWQMMPSGKPGA